MTLVFSLVSHPCLGQCALQGPWCLTGDLCWVARSLDFSRKVRCAQVMVSAMVLSLRWHGLCDGVVSAMVLSPVFWGP